MERFKQADWQLSPLSGQTNTSEIPSVPDHRLFRLIASGAYGEVWLGCNAVGTYRAVKIVRRNRHASAESFEREFNGLQKFEPLSRAHQGLVDILTLGLLLDGSGFYYVMELADDVASASAALRRGDSSSMPETYRPRTLRADLKSRGALPASEVIALGLKLTAGLSHLHSEGLVHRDVKPSNVLFIGGEPKLADAGLVAAVDEAKSLVGTAGYIAPEGPGTPHADIYALGKVLYEAAFGKDRQEFPALPADFAARPDHAILLELNEIIAKACAHDPSQRYLEAVALVDDLRVLEAGRSVRKKHSRQQFWSLGKKIAPLITVAALVALGFGRSRVIGYAESKISRVNELVDQGNYVILNGPRERYRQASDYFKLAIDIDDTFLPAYFGLFRTQVQLEGPPSLRATAAKMMSLSPSRAESRGALALVKWRDFKFREALAEAKLSTELRADSREGAAYAHLAYGFFLTNLGYPERAELEYRAGERLLPSDPFFHDHLAFTFLMRRNFSEALIHYRKSLELAPGHLNGLYWIGRTYEEMGEFEKALQSFEEFDRLDRVDEGIRKTRYGELRQAARAGREAYWRKRLEHVLKEPSPDLYKISTVYATLGEMDKAYEYLEKACEQGNFDGGPMCDLCWRHTDPRFIAIMQRFGLMDEIPR